MIMNELLWTCEGSVFASELNGVRLVVGRAPIGGGYRYQLLRRAAWADGNVISLASGYQGGLRDAMAAAERTARGFASGTHAPGDAGGGLFVSATP
jgi:hypothetical protein